MSQKGVGFLAFYQPSSTRPTTHVTRELADVLVNRLAAERISAKLIRAVPPESVYAAAKPPCSSARYLPAKLPPVEVGNCKFIPPASAPGPTMTAVREGWDWASEAL